MRISDWSSDVCSADLIHRSRRDIPLRQHLDQCAVGEMLRHEIFGDETEAKARERGGHHGGGMVGAEFSLYLQGDFFGSPLEFPVVPPRDKIGRASCRERVCQYG